jgi:nucleoside 2-deoxyribosyltransferase
METQPILLVGEIYVDFTAAENSVPKKVRLGGVCHAARGLWACNIPYAVAAFCPSYLLDAAMNYLCAHGCMQFSCLGITNGAPNVIFVSDSKETGHQGYDDILRDQREVIESRNVESLHTFKTVVIFPGSFALSTVSKSIADDARVIVDAAYGIESKSQLDSLISRISDILISTSSDLFISLGSKKMSHLLDYFKYPSARILLKENRGGSRLFYLPTEDVEYLPAVLGETLNSIGVGDVFAAVYAAFSNISPSEGAWRGMQAATNYSQTTFPDDFKRDVQRDLRIPLQGLKELGGTSLPWHDRPKFQIYLAAPDFSYLVNPEIEKAVAALEYHNFVVRRPVKENGEAKVGSSAVSLRDYYRRDVELLEDCSILFAIPLGRDPGTLVEVGMAIALQKPVITFDARQENKNTMVICGSDCYTDDLDKCLNAVFECLSKIRAKSI